MSTQSVTMSIKTFNAVMPLLPVETSVLLRAPHGVGKSQVVRQIAKAIALKEHIDDFELIDRRLSQMGEGDMIGLPSTDGEVTRFNPPEWYKRACDKACVLFLDELNRATPEVMQAAFQIVLDRELNGWKLHPQTRVFAAVNSSAQYTVNEIDPALLDRFWTIDLSPTVDDFLVWAKDGNKIVSCIVDFITANEKWLDSPANCEPGTVTPSRRSWERLSNALHGASIHENPNDPLFYPMCLGFIGTLATIDFHSFVKTIEFQPSGEEILDNYASVQKKIKKMGQEKQNVLIERVTDYITKKLKTLSDVQGANLHNFMVDLPGELRISAWSKMTQASGVDNIDLSRAIHKSCVDTILQVFDTTKPTTAGMPDDDDSKPVASKKKGKK